MKKIDKLILVVLSVLFLFGCTSQQSVLQTTNSEAFVPTGSTVIPFKIPDKHHRILPLIEMTNENGRYVFAFDTGCDYCALFGNGVKKIFGDEKKPMELAYTYLKEQSPGKNEKTLRREAEKLIDSGGITCTLTGLTVSGTAFNNTVFQYLPSATAKIDKETADGIIGLTFFGNCKNMVIDYKHHVIELDADPLPTVPLSMRKLDTLGLYVTDVTIDGRNQPALIDTGAEFLFLRDDYNSGRVYSDAEIVDHSLHGKAGKSLPGFKTVQLELGNIRSKYRGYRTTNMLMSGTESGNAFGQICSILGYSVFNRHRIQLDFEHKQFRIE
jgi:hypothetical protein